MFLQTHDHVMQSGAVIKKELFGKSIALVDHFIAKHNEKAPSPCSSEASALLRSAPSCSSSLMSFSDGVIRWLSRPYLRRRQQPAHSQLMQFCILSRSCQRHIPCILLLDMLASASFPCWASDSACQRLQRARWRRTIVFHGRSIQFLIILNSSNEVIRIICHS